MESEMDFEVLSQLFVSVLGEYWGAVVISLLCTVSAVTAAFMSAPTETSGAFYRVIYRFVNALAINVGKAKNADEVPASTTTEVKK